MLVKAAETKQKGATFVVVQVDRPVIENRELAMHIVRHLMEKFPQKHMVLWYWKPGEQPLFFGRPELAQKLDKLAMASIPWAEYEIADP